MKNAEFYNVEFENGRGFEKPVIFENGRGFEKPVFFENGRGFENDQSETERVFFKLPNNAICLKTWT